MSPKKLIYGLFWAKNLTKNNIKKINMQENVATTNFENCHITWQYNCNSGIYANPN
jgi:hypothetical protein